MFFDTDVLIWALRGHPKAEETIDQAPHILISAITYMELLQGARNRQEIIMIDQTIAIYWVSISSTWTSRSRSERVSLVKSLWHSHSLQLADAMIAASALNQGLPLVTGNVKHFHPIESLIVLPFLP